ncbi:MULTISPECIES: flagellar assembly protein T N-terminal domain-containing protein [unclassified Massilia]|uniref:flagellar assembly protein T N-terminal domain-containing protein n=1 Tax=unclassified Massilia TaxID=2609279 RepID=UPI00177F4959|nr:MULTISPECIES: flagellar assembly protein T N-terminal domain-containing protein [unclassified Massilia]MBD8532983.1 flagellar assembly protein T N-terminal domain-containing protein [Massilia sp. CFBP 13647]MBD8676364.1 flagellar assembly protein T N-terminal domain-containing protein [Massilia sp. CFBP 13721]
MPSKLRFLGAVLALLCHFPLSAAAPAEAEGVAAIADGGLARARQAAIRDALEQLGLRSGARVDVAAGASTRGKAFESSRVQAAADFDRYTVLREWQSGQLLHVRIAVKEEDARPRVGANLAYKKKIVVTPFRVRRSPQLDDVDDIATRLPQELLRRMGASGKFLGKESPYVISPGVSGPSSDTAAVRRLASMYEGQFVISGEIVDAGNYEQPAYYGLVKKDARRIEIALYVHDGLTGVLVARRTVLVEQVGERRVGRDKPFGSASFAATPFGGAILRALDDGIAAISADIGALPFMAKVVQVQGERIFIDAGSTSSVAPGDQLVIYRADPRQQVYGADPLVPLGAVETPVGTLSVVQVQPGFAIGTVMPPGAAKQVSAGDMVRFDVAVMPPR